MKSTAAYGGLRRRLGALREKRINCQRIDSRCLLEGAASYV